MSVSSVQTLATPVALASLNIYQKHISPRKGFSCPHRMLYGNQSCSEYVKDILTNQSLTTAIKMAPQRFRDCQAAARTLQQKASSGCIVIPCCLPI